MNDREREQLNLIVTHGLVTRKRALDERIDTVFADHSAKGRLHSGATVKVSVRVMHEIADDLLSDIGAKAKAIVSDKDAFDLVSTAANDFLDHCADSQLPPVIKMANGRLQGSPDGSVVRASHALFDDVRADINAKLAILAFDFGGTAPAPIIAPMASPVPSPAKKGGRPPAEFWDDMWAAIAAALYNGALVPKSQADVERAMLEWIEGNDYSAVQSTVRARARRLWDRITAPES